MHYWLSAAENFNPSLTVLPLIDHLISSITSSKTISIRIDQSINQAIQRSSSQAVKQSSNQVTMEVDEGTVNLVSQCSVEGDRARTTEYCCHRCRLDFTICSTPALYYIILHWIGSVALMILSLFAIILDLQGRGLLCCPSGGRQDERARQVHDGWYVRFGQNKTNQTKLVWMNIVNTMSRSFFLTQCHSSNFDFLQMTRTKIPTKSLCPTSRPRSCKRWLNFASTTRKTPWRKLKSLWRAKTWQTWSKSGMLTFATWNRSFSLNSSWQPITWTLSHCWIWPARRSPAWSKERRRRKSEAHSTSATTFRQKRRRKSERRTNGVRRLKKQRNRTVLFVVFHCGALGEMDKDDEKDGATFCVRTE